MDSGKQTSGDTPADLPDSWLVTGGAGFIGFNLARELIRRGRDVVNVDSVNDYYDVGLKESRLEILEAEAAAAGTSYRIVRGDLADTSTLDACFNGESFDRVVNLAAQAGVRYSMENPMAYVHSNVVAFTNILESCRQAMVPHLVYASTSSVYGGNTAMPFAESMTADHPLQFYAATKRANELMAHSYSHLFGLPTTGLRFFTVYGPWGRPDMALFLFTRSILDGKPIKLFNHGNHTRDFTYIDDIVEGIIRASVHVARPDPAWDSDLPDPSTSNAPFRVLNIGNNQPVNLSEYVVALEECLGMKAERELLPLQPGDVPDTYADVTLLQKQLGYKPEVAVKEGVRRFVDWFLEYYDEDLNS